jgi:amphi-Trp domain-containing protein
VKQKERQTYTKSELIAKLKEVINKLENESLSVGEEQVGALPESVALEMGYQDRKGKKLLEIEMEWQ